MSYSLFSLIQVHNKEAPLIGTRLMMTSFGEGRVLKGFESDDRFPFRTEEGRPAPLILQMTVSLQREFYALRLTAAVTVAVGCRRTPFHTRPLQSAQRRDNASVRSVFLTRWFFTSFGG
jgi:hypothetical protein